jgi:PAS domain S-box-containing protein
MPPAAPDEFRALADLLPEALLLVGADRTIRSSNEAAATLLGSSVAKLSGMDLGELSDAGQATELLRMGARSKSLVPGCLKLRSAGGATKVCRCDGALFRARSEAGPALVLLRLAGREQGSDQFAALNLRIEQLTREVGLRRAAESALQAQSDRLRVTLESIGDAVIATDRAGNVTLMNGVAQALTGWPIAEALGEPLAKVFSIVNEFTRDVVESPVERVMREGGIVGLANHTLLIARDGTERPIDDSGAPIRDENGRLIGVVMVFHDITERHHMERELHRKTLKLEEADKRKDDFLSMLAHELRNPLAPLTTGVQLLKKSTAEPQAVAKVAAMMGRQLAHMTRLVDDLLDVARFTQGRVELRRARVPLAGVLEQAVEVARPLIEARRHRVFVSPAPNILVDADATRLVQVFGNLLNNAAKYTPPGGDISLSSRIRSDGVVVSVKDSGEGIEPALLPSIFDLFTQGQRSLDRSQGGLGVGLTVVRAIVEMHGGTVTASSPGIGGGSTFEVHLPLAPAHPPPPDAQPVQTSTRPTPAALRVLVVDDNQDAAETLSDVVGSWGYAVATANSGAAALRELESLPAGVALLDIGMPEMDGYALARRVRSTPAGREMLLVAVTGYGLDADRQAGLQAGFDHFLTKPVDLAFLEDLLSAHSQA